MYKQDTKRGLAIIRTENDAGSARSAVGKKSRHFYLPDKSVLDLVSTESVVSTVFAKNIKLRRLPVLKFLDR